MAGQGGRARHRARPSLWRAGGGRTGAGRPAVEPSPPTAQLLGQPRAQRTGVGGAPVVLTPLHASGTRSDDSPLYDHPRYLITRSAAVACEAGQTLIAMPLALPDTAEMLRCEPVVPEVSHNQHPQS